MRGKDEAAWPAAGRSLLAELTGRPGRLCLITSTEAYPAQLVEHLASDLGLTVGSTGALLTSQPHPPTPDRLPDLLAGNPVLVDLDMLFWPDLTANPLGLLRSLARRGPIVALWPGPIIERRAIYSRPGRPDHHDVALTDAVVLRPRPARFPDETPFTIERITP
jgi:hypothetical protein